MIALLVIAGILSPLTVDSMPVVGCMMTPQDAKFRPKIIHDFTLSCAENVTPAEWREFKTGGFVMTVTKDAAGNLTGLSCAFPRPKPKSTSDKTAVVVSGGLSMNFCRDVNGVAVPTSSAAGAALPK